MCIGATVCSRVSRSERDRPCCGQCRLRRFGWGLTRRGAWRVFYEAPRPSYSRSAAADQPPRQILSSPVAKVGCPTLVVTRPLCAPWKGSPLLCLLPLGPCPPTVTLTADRTGTLRRHMHIAGEAGFPQYPPASLLPRASLCLTALGLLPPAVKRNGYLPCKPLGRAYRHLAGDLRRWNLPVRVSNLV